MYQHFHWVLLFISFAVADVIIVPSQITSSSVRAYSNEFQLWFIGNDTMISASSVTAPTTVYSTPSTVASPRGAGAYWDSLCSFPCVKIVNNSYATLVLNQVEQFDTLQPEWISVTFDRLLFTDRNARTFILRVLPDEQINSGAAFALGVLFQLATMAHSLTMPMMIDAQVVALFAMQPCMTVEQISWMPSAPSLSFLMAGNAVFDLSWRAVATVGSLIFIAVSLIGMFPLYFNSRTLVRAVLPLALLQVLFLWLPALVFASTYLVSYGYASYQVWGAFLLFGTIGLGSFAVVQVFADQTLVFIQYPVVKEILNEPSIAVRLWKRVTQTTGWWLAPRYCIMYQLADTWYLRHMNRILLPYYFGGRSRIEHMGLIGLNVLMLAATGIQARSPNGCFAQGCIIVGFIFVSSFGILAMSFKSYSVKALTCLVRLITSMQLVGFVAFPTKDFHTLFQVGTAINTVLVIARCVVIILIIGREGLSTECTEPVDLPDLRRSEPSKKPKQSRSSSPVAKVATETLVVPSSFSKLRDRLEPLVAIADSDSDDSVEEEIDRPFWLAKASPLKPKPQKGDLLQPPSPTWYPKNRPHVRTTNDADRELDVAPFTVRTTRKPPPV